MTRKDFQLIADVIAEQFNVDTACANTDAEHEEARSTRYRIATRFASVLIRATNGRFDRSRFLRACGIE